MPGPARVIPAAELRHLLLAARAAAVVLLAAGVALNAYTHPLRTFVLFAEIGAVIGDLAAASRNVTGTRLAC